MNNRINLANETRKYHIIANRLRASIENGEFPPDSFLPSHAELIAAEGVSLGTVRQALNALIMEGFAQPEHGRGVRVLDRSENQPAKALHRLGVVIAGVSADDPAYLDVVKGVSAVVSPLGGGVLVFDSEARPDNPKLPRFLSSCDGIILMGALEHAHLLLACQSKTPFVIAGHAVESLDEQENSAITLDVDAAAGMAVQMLAGFGHRSMAFCLDEIVTTYQRRLVEAAKAGATAMGIAFNTLLTPFPEKGTADVFDGLLSPCGPTALLAQGSPMARNLIKLASSRGLSVPGDLALIMIGRTERPVLAPALTQIVFDLEELGRQCARVLLGNGGAVMHRCLPPVFLPGDTVGPKGRRTEQPAVYDKE